MKLYMAAYLLIAVAALPLTARSEPSPSEPQSAAASVAPSTSAVSAHVAGTVLTPDGIPVGNATVILETHDFRSAKTSTTPSVQSDANGHFVIGVPLPPTWRQHEYLLLLASTPDGVGFEIVDSDAPITISVRPLTSVVIHLQDPNGKPVTNVEVAPRSISWKYRGAPLDKDLAPQWYQTTDANGNVTINRLPQGCQLVVDVPASYTALDKNGNIRLANGSTTPMQTFCTAPARTLSGTVRFDTSKLPAEDVVLTAYSVLTGTNCGDAASDSHGRFTFTRLQPGAYSLQLDSNNIVVANGWTAVAQTAVIPDGADYDGADMNLIPGAILAGCVLDKKTGKPLSGMDVLAIGSDHPACGSGMITGSRGVRTGSDGAFRYCVPPGDLDVMVNEPTGYNEKNSFRQLVPMAASGLRYLEIRMNQPDVIGPVHGLVVGPDAKPVAGAVIAAVGLEDTGREPITTGPDGRFEVDKPGLSSQTLLFAQAGSLFTPNGARASSTGDVVLRLARGASARLSGLVKDDDGRPLANVSVMLFGTLPGESNGIGEQSVLTDAAGRYTFAPTFCGFEYEADVISKGYISKFTRTILGVPGKVIEFPPLSAARTDGFVAGIVVDLKHNPIGGAYVMDTDNYESHAVTDTNGRFRLVDVPGKSTLINVSAPQDRIGAAQLRTNTTDNTVTVENTAEYQQTPEFLAFAAKVAADPTSHGDGTSAFTLQSAALTRAMQTNKKVLLVFGSVWCGPCFRLHRYLNDPKVKPILDSHFVVQEISIGDYHKKGWGNPGGDVLLNRYSGEGTPYFVLLDKSGKKIGSSEDSGDDVGMPGKPKEERIFLKTLKSASPTLTSAELNSLRAGLARYQPH